MADDGVLDLALAFLNSFRRYNSNIPLCLIPFNDKFAKLSELKHKYRFSIFSNEDVLAQCDEISKRFHNRVTGHYRKLAAWEGDFDEFIYIDIDTVVLNSVFFAFRFLSEFDFITSHSNLPELIQWVWKPSINATGQLTDEQIAFSANTGFITSRKSALRLECVTARVESARTLATHMRLLCKEQPFLNYLIVTSGRKYTSLWLLARKERSPDILLEAWAGIKGGVIKNGEVMLSDGTRPPIFLVHWAGKCQPRFRDELMFFILRVLGLRSKGDRLQVRFFMPYKELWEYYRLLPEKDTAKGNLHAS